MKSVLVSAFVGFSVTLGAFALFADHSFWSQDSNSTVGMNHTESATLAMTAEPSVQESASESPKAKHRKPQSEEMSIALRPKEAKEIGKTEIKKAAASKVTDEKSAPKAQMGPSFDKWSVQIASFKTQADADAKLSEMKKNGYDGFVEQAQVGGSDVFRVKIGPVATRTEAQKLQSQMVQLPGLAGSILSKSKQ